MAVATVLDSDVFRKTCGRFATGIAIATVTSLDGTPYGITVNSFTSVSAVPDRFGGLEWQHGASGVPVLDGCLANMECSIVQTIEAGDHAIFIAEVIHVRCREGKPLLYFASDYCGLRD